jgi:endoglycosylceramidase
MAKRAGADEDRSRGEVPPPLTTRRAASLALVLLTVAVAAAWAPHSTATAAVATPAHGLPFLHVGSPSGPAGLPQVVDSANRVVLLRGVNINGLEDYWGDSATPLAVPYPTGPAAYTGGACPGRNPTVESMALCDLDFPQLQALGYDSIRLAVSWSLLEPQPGRVDGRYIERIAQVVSWARAAGIYVVIDLHQDAWSKYVYTPAGQPCPPPFKTVGGFHESDGAPAWASTAVTPTCALNGTRELDTAVQEDFQRFWSDSAGPDGIGLQEHYAAVMVALARRFHDDPAVAGYEVMNEPSPGFVPPDVMDPTELFPFYGKVVNTVTTAVPGFRQLFFVEPDITRDITDRSFTLVPWSLFSAYPNVVYAPHVYTRVFTPDQALNSPALDAVFPLDGGYRSAVQDAAALGLPLWVGEFGNDVPEDGVVLRAHYANADADTIGNSLWVWKADQSANFSVYHGPFGAGVPFPSRVKFTSRAYPIFTVGRITSVAYAPDSGAFRMTAGLASPVAPPTCGDRARATVVFVPAAAGDRVAAVNAAIETVAVPGGLLLFAYPGAGDYALSVGGPGAGGARTCPGAPPALVGTGQASTPATATGFRVPVPQSVAAAALALVALSGLSRRRRERAGGTRRRSRYSD